MNCFYKKLICSPNEAYLLTSPHSLRYYTGFEGGEGIGLLGLDFKILITDSRYTEEAAAEAKNFEIIEKVPYIAALFNILKERRISKVYFEDEEISFSEFGKLKSVLGDIELIPSSDKIEGNRTIKDDFETALIKKSEEIAVKAYKKVLCRIKPGVTENEIAAELEYQMKLLGAEKTSFDTIVISGSKTSLPHGKPSDKKIEIGDFITMDFGCVYKGYCSDMTRTVVCGKATEEQKLVYNTVLAAQEEGIRHILPDAPAASVDMAARNIIENAGFGKYFGHALGHGVGLKIHEAPSLSPKSEYILKENMLVTCEPGIYIPGKFGVRIEDLLCVKQEKAENFTQCEKKLMEIM